MTRLANTQGTMIIETPPRGPSGKVYNIYRQSKIEPDNLSVEGQFKVITISAREAVAADIITDEFLDGERARLGPQYSMYYEVDFSSFTGNAFSQYYIDKVVELGKKYPVTINPNAEHSLGIDPGFGPSSCAFVLLEHSDGIVKVVYAKHFERSDSNAMIHNVWEILNMIGSPQALDAVYIDSMNPEFIKGVKQELGEDDDWFRNHEKILQCRREGGNILHFMKVVPISFREEGPAMLSLCKKFIEHDDTILAIHPQFDQLITALRGAVSKDYRLDKKILPLNDLTDSFMLAMNFFTLQK
jgi:hypothetical protein